MTSNSNIENLFSQNKIQNLMELCYQNDISPDEFDAEYQRCLACKNQKSQILKDISNEMNKISYDKYYQDIYQQEAQGDEMVNNTNMIQTYPTYEDNESWQEEEFDEADYEEELTNEEIDAAFAEAERWSDF